MLSFFDGDDESERAGLPFIFPSGQNLFVFISSRPASRAFAFFFFLKEREREREGNAETTNAARQRAAYLFCPLL